MAMILPARVARVRQILTVQRTAVESANKSYLLARRLLTKEDEWWLSNNGVGLGAKMDAAQKKNRELFSELDEVIVNLGGKRA